MKLSTYQLELIVKALESQQRTSLPLRARELRQIALAVQGEVDRRELMKGKSYEEM